MVTVIAFLVEEAKGQSYVSMLTTLFRSSPKYVPRKQPLSSLLRFTWGGEGGWVGGVARILISLYSPNVWALPDPKLLFAFLSFKATFFLKLF